MYEITSITDLVGRERTDGSYPRRIGRRCEITLCEIGKPMLIDYRPREGEAYQGTLQTSTVSAKAKQGKVVVAITMNSIYCFEEVNDAERGQEV